METKNRNRMVAQLNQCANSEELIDYITRNTNIDPDDEPDDDIDW